MKTKVIPNSWNGKPMFTIAEVDDNGEIILGKKFIVNMGLKKAKAVYDKGHLLEKFVKENE